MVLVLVVLWYFVMVTQCHQMSRTCRDSVEMGESPFMRDGWAVLQPTLTAQPSRSTQRTGPAVLLFLFHLGLHCNGLELCETVQ